MIKPPIDTPFTPIPQPLQPDKPFSPIDPQQSPKPHS
jgi:hypothetical protein